jgi:energy-converting hydrogenase A subunit M
MKDETEQTAELDRLQAAYKAAVERWVRAIREEEALASVNHTVAEVDQWEGAHFREDELRQAVIAAKKEYEDALRHEFFDF